MWWKFRCVVSEICVWTDRLTDMHSTILRSTTGGRLYIRMLRCVDFTLVTPTHHTAASRWQLTYNASDMIGPSVTVYLQECKSPVMLPVEQTMDTALVVLRAAATTELFYRQHAWDAVRCYLVASVNLDDDEQMQTCFFTHPRCVRLLGIVTYH